MLRLSRLLLLLLLLALPSRSSAQAVIVGQPCGAGGLNAIATNGVPVVCTGNPLVWTSPTGSGGGISLPGGNVGQVAVNTGPGAGSWQDPVVSSAYVNLFNVASATGTQTSSNVRNPTFSQTGTLSITWSSITGSPSGCTIQMKAVDSLGNAVNNGAAIAVTPSNGTTTQVFAGVPTLPTAAQIAATYACSTTYPSTGTLSLDFTPAPAVPSNGGFSNGTWVTTTDALWNQLTQNFSGGQSGGSSCCSATNYTLTTNFRILQSNGTIYDSAVKSAGWSITVAASNNGVCGTGELFPVSGWLQSVTTYISASTGGVVQPGQVFSNLYILGALPGGGSTSSCIANGITASNINHILTGFPLSTFYPMSWQTGVASQGPSASMPGQIASYNPANPAAGTASVTMTAPSVVRQVMVAAGWQLVTSNQAGNRTVCIFINNGSGYAGGAINWYSCASGIQPPSTTINYTAAVGVGAGSGGNSFQQTIPLPVGLEFPAGASWQLSITVNGVQTSDQLQNIFFQVKAYPEND